MCRSSLTRFSEDRDQLRAVGYSLLRARNAGRPGAPSYPLLGRRTKAMRDVMASSPRVPGSGMAPYMTCTGGLPSLVGVQRIRPTRTVATPAVHKANLRRTLSPRTPPRQAVATTRFCLRAMTAGDPTAPFSAEATMRCLRRVAAASWRAFLRADLPLGIESIGCAESSSRGVMVRPPQSTCPSTRVAVTHCSWRFPIAGTHALPDLTTEPRLSTATRRLRVLAAPDNVLSSRAWQGTRHTTTVHPAREQSKIGRQTARPHGASVRRPRNLTASAGCARARSYPPNPPRSGSLDLVDIYT